MALSVDRRGIASIMEGFELFKTPYYTLWQGSALKYIHDDDDKERAMDLLMDNLRAALGANSDAIYQIRFYRDVPQAGITDKTPYFGSFNFKVKDEAPQYVQPIAPAPQPSMAGYGYSRDFEARIAALENQQDYPIPDEPEDDGSLVSRISNNPEMMKMITDLINSLRGFFSGLFNGSAPAAQAPPADHSVLTTAGSATAGMGLSPEEQQLLQYWRNLDEGTKSLLKNQM